MPSYEGESNIKSVSVYVGDGPAANHQEDERDGGTTVGHRLCGTTNTRVSAGLVGVVPCQCLLAGNVVTLRTAKESLVKSIVIHRIAIFGF